MLIVEGPDLVGKTTLCHELVKRLAERGPWVYAHFSRLPESWHYYWDYLPHMAQHQVMDRFHMSEVAYRFARSEEQRLFPEVYRALDGRLRLYGAFTVVVTATVEWLRARLDSRPEEHTGEQIMRANYAFGLLADRMMGDYRPDCDMRYVVGAHDQGYPSSCDEFVRRVVQRYRERQAWVDGLAQSPPAFRRESLVRP